MKQKNNKKEIIWNIINSLLAGGLVFLGAISDGQITMTGIVASFAAAFAVAIKQFQSYWASEQREYCAQLFKFV